MLIRWDEQHFRPIYNNVLVTATQRQQVVLVLDQFDAITEVEFDIMIETLSAGFNMVCKYK
jgi:hypothetical protein